MISVLTLHSNYLAPVAQNAVGAPLSARSILVPFSELEKRQDNVSDDGGLGSDPTLEEIQTLLDRIQADISDPNASLNEDKVSTERAQLKYAKEELQDLDGADKKTDDELKAPRDQVKDLRNSLKEYGKAHGDDDKNGGFFSHLFRDIF